MPGIVAETRYLVFYDTTDMPDQAKTKRVEVISKTHGNVLGEIRWYGAWRQYCFYPRANTIWNVQCLGEVEDRTRAMMAHRRAMAALKKQGA